MAINFDKAAPLLQGKKAWHRKSLPTFQNVLFLHFPIRNFEWDRQNAHLHVFFGSSGQSYVLDELRSMWDMDHGLNLIKAII